MNIDTVKRALVAVREKIAAGDKKASDWRVERDRRRRQMATFLARIVHVEGSQRKAAIVTGISQSTISRIIDPEGHVKVRKSQADRRDATTGNVASAAEPTADNVVPIRRRRADWKPREPSRTEVHKWFNQYLGWTRDAQKKAGMLVLNHTSGSYPDEAYEPEPPGSDSAVGTEKRRRSSGD